MNVVIVGVDLFFRCNKVYFAISGIVNENTSVASRR